MKFVSDTVSSDALLGLLTGSRTGRLGVYSCFILCFACCTDDGGSRDSAGADVDSGPLASMGESCSADTDCARGICLLSEYSPVGFCTEPCVTGGAPCDAPEGTAPTSYCVEMPEEFIGPIRKFCAPLCKTKQECQTLSSTWETCAEPAYKGNPLYPSEVGVFVCQSPSATGARPVDAETCADWRKGYGDFVSQQNICVAYCDYLTTCGVTPKNADCCAYGCMLSMVVQGELDDLYEKEKKCMVTAYDGFRNTVQWCSAPPEQCNSAWEDTSP